MNQDMRNYIDGHLKSLANMLADDYLPASFWEDPMLYTCPCIPIPHANHIVIRDGKPICTWCLSTCREERGAFEYEPPMVPDESDSSGLYQYVTTPAEAEWLDELTL